MAVDPRRPAPRAWLADLDALEARERIARGEFKSADLVEACLQRIEERDAQVKAFAHLDAELARKQASIADRQRASGRPTGPLHGVPVALKDTIDVRGLPAENGTVLDAGRRPMHDAALVSRLREAGAIVLGKTVTTELALMHAGKTHNPHDTSRTPGGSSSGSAAAVAARMVPLAVGTQTNGSVIRPASYCGVVGFKPSFGLISRRGVLKQSPALDTVGVFARTVEDAAFLADALCGYDEQDPGSELVASPQMLLTARSDPPLRPVLAAVRSPVWDEADEDLKEGFGELCEELGDAIQPLDLPEPFARAHDLHAAVMNAEIAVSYQPYVERGDAQLSAVLRALMESGRKVPAVDYLRARDGMRVLGGALERIFGHFDAIVTPAAPGEAPAGLESTGSPAFSTIWTFCGVPAISLPLLVGRNGLPIGVQLVGRRGYDGRLLRTARWLTARIEQPGTVRADDGRRSAS